MNRREVFSHRQLGKKKKKGLSSYHNEQQGKIEQYKTQGDIKTRETIEIESEVRGKRINKSQEEESSHKSIWKVPAQVSLHRMVD